MSNANAYLLEETEEALLLRDNIKRLLLSEDDANAIVALQMIEGGGFHVDFTEAISHAIFNQIRCYTGRFIGTIINHVTYQKVIEELIEHFKIDLYKVSIRFVPYEWNSCISVVCTFLGVVWSFYFTLT